MYQKTTLDNGLRVTTATMPHTRSVCIGFFIGVGSRYETDAEAGVSHFIEHLCFKGTHKRATAREISETIEGTGEILNGGTDKELTGILVQGGSIPLHPRSGCAGRYVTPLLRRIGFVLLLLSEFGAGHAFKPVNS